MLTRDEFAEAMQTTLHLSKADVALLEMRFFPAGQDRVNFDHFLSVISS